MVTNQGIVRQSHLMFFIEKMHDVIPLKQQQEQQQQIQRRRRRRQRQQQKQQHQTVM